MVFDSTSPQNLKPHAIDINLKLYSATMGGEAVQANLVAEQLPELIATLKRLCSCLETAVLQDTSTIAPHTNDTKISFVQPTEPTLQELLSNRQPNRPAENLDAIEHQLRQLKECDSETAQLWGKALAVMDIDFSPYIEQALPCLLSQLKYGDIAHLLDKSVLNEKQEFVLREITEHLLCVSFDPSENKSAHKSASDFQAMLTSFLRFKKFDATHPSLLVNPVGSDGTSALHRLMSCEIDHWKDPDFLRWVCIWTSMMDKSAWAVPVVCPQNGRLYTPLHMLCFVFAKNFNIYLFLWIIRRLFPNGNERRDIFNAIFAVNRIHTPLDVFVAEGICISMMLLRHGFLIFFDRPRHQKYFSLNLTAQNQIMGDHFYTAVAEVSRWLPEDQDWKYNPLEHLLRVNNRVDLNGTISDVLTKIDIVIGKPNKIPWAVLAIYYNLESEIFLTNTKMNQVLIDKMRELQIDIPKSIGIFMERYKDKCEHHLIFSEDMVTRVTDVKFQN